MPGHRILRLVHVGVTFRIESREFGERKQVLGLCVNPGASDEPGLAQPLLREGITQHEVFQAQERAVLHLEGRILGGTPAAHARNVAHRIFGSPASAVLLPAVVADLRFAAYELRARGVEDVIAVIPLEKDVQVEAEEFEGVVETSRVQRLSASDDRTVVGIDRAVAVDVAEARVARLHARTAGAVVGNVGFEDPFAVDVVEVVVFVSPFVDIAVKHAHRLADFGDIGVVIGDDIDNALLIVRQRQHLVAVEGDVEIGRPAEVFRVEILGLECEFPSLIPDFSDIHGVGGEARRRRNVGGQQQVGGNLAVPVHGDRKPVAEQPQIDSCIPLRGGLPCIRCAKCVSACPMGLEPYLLATVSAHGDFERVEKEDVMSCIECGSCQFTCPSNRPLLDYIRLGKGKVGAMIRARQVKK